MEERRIDRQRYWLAHFFEDVPIGGQFPTSALHLTIATWFVVNIEESALLKSFQQKFAGLKSFELKIDGQAKLGPKKDVLANLLEPNKQITSLHKRALGWMEEIGARWAVKNPHSGADYMPHIRYREGSELVSGEVLRINSLTLVKARRREDGLRTVAAKVEFDG